MSAVKLACSPLVLLGAMTNAHHGNSAAVLVLQARLRGQSRTFNFTLTTLVPQPCVYIQQNGLCSELLDVIKVDICKIQGVHKQLLRLQASAAHLVGTAIGLVSTSCNLHRSTDHRSFHLQEASCKILFVTECCNIAWRRICGPREKLCIHGRLLGLVSSADLQGTGSCCCC